MPLCTLDALIKGSGVQGTPMSGENSGNRSPERQHGRAAPRSFVRSGVHDDRRDGNRDPSASSGMVDPKVPRAGGMPPCIAGPVRPGFCA